MEYPQERGEYRGFKITQHADRFEATRGERVLAEPWAGPKVVPTLEKLLDRLWKEAECLTA